MRISPFVLISLLVLTASESFCQEKGSLGSMDLHIANHQYDQDLLSKEFHKMRRDELRNLMPDSSVAVFFSNPVRNRSNDVNFQYHQDPNFYYLTGLREPNALLLVFKGVQDFDSLITNELLFVQDRDAKREIWDGRRLGKKGANEVLGFQTALVNNQFADFKIDFSKYKKVFFIPLDEGHHDDKGDRGDLSSLMNHFNKKIDGLGKRADGKKLWDLMASLREVKHKEELELLRKAVTMTCLAQVELMKALEPGMTEYQAQGIIEYYFKKYGSEHPGFPSIIGGGENSCILHYTTNRKPLYNKDMLVVDVGAEYHGYTADVTRTLPVKGKYSEEQKTIYNIVLEAQNAGIKACKAGNRFWEPNIMATQVIQRRLLGLGIIKKPNDVNKYFMHGTSHYLGLDVHDAGLYGNLVPGNVITVEPGIYIPEGSDCDPKWWNIGVRIEDDILITNGEPENLSESAPRTIEEIEKLMKEISIFNEKR